jgi:uncharacterized RmlC-like cupin family protein
VYILSGVLNMWLGNALEMGVRRCACGTLMFGCASSFHRKKKNCFMVKLRAREMPSASFIPETESNNVSN